MVTIDEASFESQTKAGLRYRSPAGLFEVAAQSETVLRMRLGDGAAGEAVQLAARAPSEEFEARVAVGDPANIATKSLSARVETNPFRLVLGNGSGATNLTEFAFLIEDDAGAKGESGACANRSVSSRVGARMRFPSEHHFYGLGHGGKQFDRSGAQRQLWNTHIGHGPGADFGVPLLLSNRGYGLLFDTGHDARITVGRTDRETRILFEAEAGPVDFYYLCADDFRGLLGVVADILGHATMPPLWFLGYLQSTRHFDDTAELRRLGRTLRDKKIPCDGLIFLSTYGDARGWNRQVGYLDFEPSLFRDAGKLVKEMKEQQFRIMTHEYPVVHPDSPLFAEAEKQGYLLEVAYPKQLGRETKGGYSDGQRYLDFTNPDCRRWWWEQHRELVGLGVDGWWLDGGEGPAAETRLHAGPGTALHNVYDLQRFRAFAEGEGADRPNKRPALLARSGAAGMQQFGAACWSGDIDNTFATLASQLPVGLNTGLSGIPYWGTDIGGFFHPVEESGELFVRWFQFATFCPIFRAHGYVWREHLPWSHGAEVEAICRRYSELRYLFLPYTYSLAWQARSSGLPLMRPLVLNYPDDPRVWDLGDEYLWGDDVMVAPVTREGARSWAVYLPEGDWYDYWTWTHYRGAQAVEVDAPLDRLPLFVRAGAVIPCASPTQHTSDITLLAVPGTSSRFSLYDDDGETNDYQRGRFALTELSCRSKANGIVFSVGAPTGDPSLVPTGRRYIAKIRSPRPDRVLDGGGSSLSPASPNDPESFGFWHEDGFVYIRMTGLANEFLLSFGANQSTASP